MVKIEPFEKHTNQYEAWFEQNPFVYQSELRAVKALLPEKGEGFEIGVGSGRFAAPLHISIGIEPSQKMGKIAQGRGIDVVCGSAESIPFYDSQFDFALMVTTICFLDDIKLAFKETYRVLKTDGQLVIGFVDRESPLGKHYQKHKNKSVFYKMAHFYSTDEIVSYLKETGFKKINFIQTIFKPLKEIDKIEPIRKGHTKGSFVVVSGIK